METTARSALVRSTVLATAASLVLLSAAPARAVVSYGSAGGTQVYLTSDSAGDTMALTCTAGQVRYLAANLLACNATTSIIITGNAGNDDIDLSALQPGDFPASIDVYIDPGSGADDVMGSQAADTVVGDFADTIQGLGGNDKIVEGDIVYGGEGDDVLERTRSRADGGPGDDVIRQPATGPFVGGAGIDTVEVDYSTVNAGEVNFAVDDSLLHLDVPAGPFTVDIPSIQIERYDFKLPQIGLNTWNSAAFSGSVDINGLGGVDRMIAGPGEDFLNGGADNDEITGGAGFDYIQGGAGDDTIMARDGEVDRVICGDGTDTVTADTSDVLTGCETVLLPVVAPPAPVAPDTGAITGPKKVAKGKTAKFKFPASAGVTFQCKLDSGKWKACTSPHKVRTKKLKLGKHTIRVRAVRAGLVDASPSKKAFKVVRP
jgi:Ca2+-binding RTX toxin-like protein